jgi:CspA family cold shock protein
VAHLSGLRAGERMSVVFRRLCGQHLVAVATAADFLYDNAVHSNAMAKGVVDFFNDTGGYGFIETEDSDEDVFFHMEDVGGPDLEEGDEVEFDIEQADKGPRAKNLTRL